MRAVHYVQEGNYMVRRPVCNPNGYDSYEWNMSRYWFRVTCKNCLRYKKKRKNDD